MRGWGSAGGWVGGVGWGPYLQEDAEHGQPARVPLRRAGIGETLGVKVHHVHLRRGGTPEPLTPTPQSP